VLAVALSQLGGPAVFPSLADASVNMLEQFGQLTLAPSA
jgi:hypothetical protein